MTLKRGGLGRNLTALLGQSSNQLLSETPADRSMTLAVTCLQPGQFQPRAEIDDASLSDLAHSIKQQGVLQPLIIRALSDGRYEIIAGERRWRASQLAGLTEVPVILKQVDDETAMAMALVENLQREDLNAMDQARAMQRLVTEFALTHQQIAELLSKSRTAVSNFLRLLSLSSQVKCMLEHGDIDMGHARALLGLDEAMQLEAAELIVSKQLSVRETEQMVTRLKKGGPKPKVQAEIATELKSQMDSLAKQIETSVKLKPGKSGKGQLVIHYDSPSRLENILHRFLD